MSARALFPCDGTESFELLFKPLEAEWSERDASVYTPGDDPEADLNTDDVAAAWLKATLPAPFKLPNLHTNDDGRISIKDVAPIKLEVTVLYKPTGEVARMVNLQIPDDEWTDFQSGDSELSYRVGVGPGTWDGDQLNFDDKPDWLGCIKQTTARAPNGTCCVRRLFSKLMTIIGSRASNSCSHATTSFRMKNTMIQNGTCRCTWPTLPRCVRCCTGHDAVSVMMGSGWELGTGRAVGRRRVELSFVSFRTKASSFSSSSSSHLPSTLLARLLTLSLVSADNDDNRTTKGAASPTLSVSTLGTQTHTHTNTAHKTAHTLMRARARH